MDSWFRIAEDQSWGAILSGSVKNAQIKRHEKKLADLSEDKHVYTFRCNIRMLAFSLFFVNTSCSAECYDDDIKLPSGKNIKQ